MSGPIDLVKFVAMVIAVVVSVMRESITVLTELHSITGVVVSTPVVGESGVGRRVVRVQRDETDLKKTRELVFASVKMIRWFD